MLPSQSVLDADASFNGAVAGLNGAAIERRLRKFGPSRASLGQS